MRFERTLLIEGFEMPKGGLALKKLDSSCSIASAVSFVDV